MNEADFVICAVLLVSTVVGVSRGVVREILAIVGWAVAIFLALNYSPELAGLGKRSTMRAESVYSRQKSINSHNRRTPRYMAMTIYTET